jgi:hypothetical protein
MEIDLSSLESVTRLAQQYGPFLFAMLFIFVVTRTAHKYYLESNTRQQPPASEEEKTTYRSYFRTSVWVGIALTLLSIGWWIYVQMQGPSIYQIAIVGLQPDESVLSQYYFKTVPRPTIPGAVAPHDDYFIVAQDQPIKIGDTFDFYYFKTPPTQAVATPGGQPAEAVGITGTPIEIKYSGNTRETYQVTQNGGTVSLKIVASNPTATGSVLVADGDQGSRPQLASLAVTSLMRSGP